MSHTPGMLYVTMQPKPGLALDQFHEWYNNEHGPARLRLPAVFANGLRYAATDGQHPHFLAAYDVTSMHHLATPTYTDLRAHRSPREADTIGQVDVRRFFYDLVSERTAAAFRPIASLSDQQAEGQVLVAVESTLAERDGAEEQLRKWYEEEHMGLLAKVPGWLRSRLFRTATSLAPHAPVTILALHEYARDNGLGGPAFHAATTTPWRADVFDTAIARTTRRVYSLFYVFGPGPRDLQSLAALPASQAFASADARIATTPHATRPALRAFVTAADGLALPYQLEGNPDPRAPTVALVNSLLTSLHMWDAFVALLVAARPELRILRYDHRGRHAVPAPPAPATLALLCDDLAALLAGLRIDTLHALVGVSLGGATTLHFALTRPRQLARFVACDCNTHSSAGNTAAWKARIALAERDDGDVPGMRTLAAQTVERWFHPHTLAAKRATARRMADMVAANDVQGFRYGCQALWDYDLRADLPACRVPGLLVVGEGDAQGALVTAMDAFRARVGAAGVELRVVAQAGHLPMSENPEAFWDAVRGFL